MALASQLGKQIEEIVGSLNEIGASFALIGGLALASHRVVRATHDVDLLADIDIADQIDKLALKLGYQCIFRSAEAANYLRGSERLDFLFASRPIARRLLISAGQHPTAFGSLKVVSSEGLIAFKLQGFVNDPRRTQDLEDIRALLRANLGSLNMTEIREYFRLFDRESLLDELLNAAK